MSNRQEIANAAAAGLRAFSQHAAQTQVMLGFDAMADTILHIVDTRHGDGPDEYQPIQTIERFAQKLLKAAGQSSNYEMIIKQEKLGGNSPIMGNAMLRAGLAVTYIGQIGHPTIHPNFQDFADGCAECISIVDPGYTDAFEFSDGKLMMGKHENCREVNVRNLKQVVGNAKMTQVVQRSRMVAMLNWTMLLQASNIWQWMIDEIFPNVDWKSEGRQFIFIDLCDPEKRTREDLTRAMKMVRQMQTFTDVVLGLNLKEAEQVAEVVGVTLPADTEANVEALARDIRAALDLWCVAVHPRKAAAGAMKTQQGVETAWFAGPFVKEPKLSTGAGDNFNAGFCLGLLANLPLVQCLCAGKAASGFYVRNAGSATLEELATFCENIPDSQ